MKVNLTGGGVLALGAVAAGVGLLYLVKTKGGQAAAAVVKAVNPADSGNLINQGVSALGRSLTGDTNFSLGGWLYDLTHDDGELTAPTPAPYSSKGPSTRRAITPAAPAPASPSIGPGASIAEWVYGLF